MSGTTALTDDGLPIAPDDAHEQTLVVLGVIVKALQELGASPEDVHPQLCVEIEATAIVAG